MAVEEMIKQMPSAAAILVVVIVFIRFLREESARRERGDIERHKVFEQLGEGCHDHTMELNERASAAIDRAAAAVDSNTKSLGAIAELMRGCADRANGKKPS